MACPNCDHTMQCIGTTHEIDPPAATFWCPRCGTIKDRNGVEVPTNRDALLAAAKAVEKASHIHGADRWWIALLKHKHAEPLRHAIDCLYKASEASETSAREAAMSDERNAILREHNDPFGSAPPDPTNIRAGQILNESQRKYAALDKSFQAVVDDARNQQQQHAALVAAAKAVVDNAWTGVANRDDLVNDGRYSVGCAEYEALEQAIQQCEAMDARTDTE